MKDNKEVKRLNKRIKGLEDRKEYLKRELSKTSQRLEKTRFNAANAKLDNQTSMTVILNQSNGTYKRID